MTLPRRDFLFLGTAPFLKIPARPLPRSVIRIHMTGGPSQIDTFDPKPHSPFQAIRTSAPDIQISELFPLIGRQAHRLALVRSVYTDAGAVHPCFPARGSFSRAVKAVEAGERRVDIPMFTSASDGLTWDMHGWKPFSTMNAYRDVVAPMFDRAFSGLIEDLAQRGLLESTLVVAMGEFGRSPRLNPNGGRDHWTHCFTAILAGAGIEGGQILGTSDATGSEPRDNPVSASVIEAMC